MSKKEKQAAFLQVYEKSFGNITQSCRHAAVVRQTYYDWLKVDDNFKRKVEAIEASERFVDFAEDALVKRINEGDTTAIIFALKTRGKRRGYVEKIEQEHSGKTEILVRYAADDSPNPFDASQTA